MPHDVCMKRLKRCIVSWIFTGYVIENKGSETIETIETIGGTLCSQRVSTTFINKASLVACGSVKSFIMYIIYIYINRESKPIVSIVSCFLFSCTYKAKPSFHTYRFTIVSSFHRSINKERVLERIQYL